MTKQKWGIVKKGLFYISRDLLDVKKSKCLWNIKNLAGCKFLS